MRINNVLICGLGAVGVTFGAKMIDKCNLKILVDENRLKRYNDNPPTLNGKILAFDYITPNDSFMADFVIIATKSQGLENALFMMKNFVSNETKIISLINGISSEEVISSTFPKSKVLKSYFIGHSAVRVGNNITQDGIGKIVFEKDDEVAEFFNYTGINYEMPKDIDYSMWLKYTLNLFSNQTSAVLNTIFGEMKNSEYFKEFAKKIIYEVKLIAEKKGIHNLENLEKDALKALNGMCDEGKTSMLQDILANRKTEVDIFAGEMIRLGKLYGVQTPINQVLYDLIKIREEINEYRIHTC